MAGPSRTHATKPPERPAAQRFIAAARQAATVHAGRATVTAAANSSQALQSRLGNFGTQALLASSVGAGAGVRGASTRAPTLGNAAANAVGAAALVGAAGANAPAGTASDGRRAGAARASGRDAHTKGDDAASHDAKGATSTAGGVGTTALSGATALAGAAGSAAGAKGQGGDKAHAGAAQSQSTGAAASAAGVGAAVLAGAAGGAAGEKAQATAARAAGPGAHAKGDAAKPGAQAHAAGSAAHAAGAAKEKSAHAAAPDPRQAIAPATKAVRSRATAAQGHQPARDAVDAAQASAIKPKSEQAQSAAAETVTSMGAAKADAVRRSEFKDKLRKAIQDATPQPKTESEADKVMKSGGAQASATLRGQMVEQRDAAGGPMKTAATSDVPPDTQPAPKESPLKVQPPGAPPAPVSAGPVVPAPLPAERLDYSADRGPTEQVMAQNNVSQEQLNKGNDPAFGPTLQARSDAEKHEASAEGQYRKQEAKVQGNTQAIAAGALAQGLGAIHGGRVDQLGKVGGKQHGTASKDQLERERIKGEIVGIKDRAKDAVGKILEGMDTEAGAIFDRGLKRAEAAYEKAFDDAKGGVGTWLTTWGDDWDKLIESSLVTARNEYMRQVDVAIDEVADYVDRKIKEARDRVALGRKEIDDKVASLSGSLKESAETARDEVSTDFDDMTSMIDERRDALIDKLAQQYKDSYERMSAREEELREANKSLWKRVYDATVGLIKKIIAFKDMLLNVLARAAAVIGDIISDPIGFLGNLVNGVMLGLKNFMSNIGAHLKKGLMDWLFGALAGAGLQLPDTFDLKGIISIVLQILGLTYTNFRKRAVAIVGEPVVAALEQAAEVFKIILTEGVGGLWRFIMEKLGDLKSMVLDAIFDYIKEKVIIAGVTWIIGLLNPASAFFKACKAIYDIVMFFVNRGSQILSLVNAVIDSIAAIVKGNISVAANFVEAALAKAVPVAIGFLAGLLGLGDPSKPVRNTIEKAQSPVNKAIDWVIHQAVKLVKTAGKFVKSLFGKKEGDKNEKTNDVRDVAGNAMADLVGSETTPEQAQNAAQSISQQLAPQGLRRVYLGVPDEEGNTPIFAEASPPKRVRILARKRVTVSVEAKIQVSGAPALEGLNQTGFAQFDKERAAVMGGTGKAAMLPEVSQPPGVSAKHGTQRSSGMVLEPKAGSRSIEVVAWNTGQKILQHNPSHAEKQFIEWFWSRPKAWRERVTSVSVIISGREICDYCMGDIKNVESGHPWIHFFWLRGDADKKKDKKSEKLDVKK